MNVQLTKYGIEQVASTQKPLEIVRYVLGTSYGYNPSVDDSGIRGKSVYTNSVIGPDIITANVYKYTVALDYAVGPFYFGEIAYYDANGKCVALAVSESQIEKLAMSNRSSGNSLKLDAYLSMVGNTYSMWSDSIGSNSQFQIPTLGSVDELPSVQSSDPNTYIISPASSNSTAVVAYNAGSTGLWNFDCYTYGNVRERVILSATPTSLTFDCSDIDLSAIEDMRPVFLGDKVLEFSSGELYSICRTVSSVVVSGRKVTVSFRAPLAILPVAGDTVLYFSRTDVSRSDMPIRIASETDIGGIRIGEDLSIDFNGIVNLAFDPVKSVNGILPDAETGEVTLGGIVSSVALESNADLDEIVSNGVYHASDDIAETIANSPVSKSFVLLCVNSDDVVSQQLSDGALTYMRNFDGEEWTAWDSVSTSKSAIACGTF